MFSVIVRDSSTGQCLSYFHRLSVCLFACLRLSVCMFVCLFVGFFFCLSLSICLLVCLPAFSRVSVSLSVSSSGYFSASLCLFDYLSILHFCLSVCLSLCFCPSVCLSVCLVRQCKSLILTVAPTCLCNADDTQSDIGVESRLWKSTSKIGTDFWGRFFILNPLGMKNRHQKQTWRSAT